MEDPMFEMFRGFPEEVRAYLAGGNGVRKPAEDFYLMDDDAGYRRLITRGIPALINPATGAFDDVDQYAFRRFKPAQSRSRDPFFRRFLVLPRPVQELLAARLRPAEVYYSLAISEGGVSREREQEFTGLQAAVHELLERGVEGEISEDFQTAKRYVAHRLMI